MSGLAMGHIYNNPEYGQGLSGEIEVVPASGELPAPRQQAVMYQDLILQALHYQFGGLRNLDQIRQTADPDDESMVKAQQARLAEADGLTGHPQYFQANFPMPVEPVGSEAGAAKAWYMAGLGKAKYADARSREEREKPSTPAERANLADISDIYVRPELQHRGFGSALEREMLDLYPVDMAAVVYEYPLLNPLVTARIQKAGFSPAKQQVVEFCGAETLMVMYAGPAVGDEIERAEAERPWLREREPVVSLAPPAPLPETPDVPEDAES